MSIKIKKMCRGQGVEYILVESSGFDSLVFFAASESGVELPLEAYEIGAEGSCNQVVLITPLLDTKRLVIKAKDSNGSAVYSKSISREQLKWSSRFYYRFDWEGAHKLRDVECFAYSNQIHIKPSFVTRSHRDATFVVKGVICGPRDMSDCNLALLNREGVAIDDFSAELQKANEVERAGFRRVEVSFSARVPDDGLTYCLVAKGNNTRDGFMCFDAPSKDYYLGAFGSPWFRRASGDDWKNAVSDREKLICLSDPRDFEIEDGPLFSIVVPLYNTPVSLFEEAVNSVVSQFYANWELILVNSTPENKLLSKAISKIDDPRVKTVVLEKNFGIAENTNNGVQVAKGDYIVFFDHDDLLDVRVLFEYAKRIKKDPSIDVLYCDEDSLNERGEFVNPHYKSAFNIDLLRVHNYITHLLAVRASYAKRMPLNKQFDGAQDYDFVLRLADERAKFQHVPEILYHWRMSDTSTAKSSGNKPYAENAGCKALQEHLDRNGLDGIALSSDVPFLYKVEYKVIGSPLVSIIIPNKDSSSVLSRCIDSIENKSSYANYEIVIVENNSTEPCTFDYYDDVRKRYGNVRVVTWDSEFNYSRINNFGAQCAKGDYYLLLNNDTEVVTPDWIESMLGFCQRKDVGAVGVKLLFPDDTIQHAGVAMPYCENATVMGGPVHVFSNLDKDETGYMNRAAYSQDVNIVTAACLMVSKECFELVGGLSEQFAVAYNDVDFCLKLRKAGYLVVYDADAVLYHYESFSRGSDTSDDNKIRFMSEQGKLRAAWPEYYALGDEYYTKYVVG